MHPQLAEALRRRATLLALPTARVWSDTVGDVTRLRDFLRAGIARRVDVVDAEGKPVKIGTGKRERVKTRIVVEDDEGRVIDLHALRTTLGTQLARAGVTPQVAQRIMRHSDHHVEALHHVGADGHGCGDGSPAGHRPRAASGRGDWDHGHGPGYLHKPAAAILPAVGARNGAKSRGIAR